MASWCKIVNITISLRRIKLQLRICDDVDAWRLMFWWVCHYRLHLWEQMMQFLLRHWKNLQSTWMRFVFYSLWLGMCFICCDQACVFFSMARYVSYSLCRMVLNSVRRIVNLDDACVVVKQPLSSSGHWARWQHTVSSCSVLTGWYKWYRYSWC